jgi:hypothetical protein
MFIRLYGVVAIGFWALIILALGAVPDAEAAFTCSAGQSTVQLMDASGVIGQKHEYSFKTSCTEQLGANTENDFIFGSKTENVSTHISVMGTAQWDRTTGKASESLAISGMASGKRVATGICNQDPFLKDPPGAPGALGACHSVKSWYESTAGPLYAVFTEQRFWFPKTIPLAQAQALSVKHPDPNPAIPPPPKLAPIELFWEGEQLVPQAKASAGKVFGQGMAPFGSGWSGNAQLFWRDAIPGATLRLPLLINSESWYDVAMRLTKAPDYANLHVWMDGKRVGQKNFSGYSQKVSSSGWTDFGGVFLTKGQHELVLEIIGKETYSQGYFVGLDQIHLTPMVLMEGEHLLKDAQVTAGGFGVQAMAQFGSGWSGNAQLIWKGTGPGGQLTIPVMVPSKASYIVQADLTKARDYGDLDLLVDGKKLGPSFSGYHPAIQPASPIRFGSLELQAGPHQLTFVVIGKHPASTNYFVGLDRIILIPGMVVQFIPIGGTP